MDMIELARQLGAAIQNSDEYKAMALAKNEADKDEELQHLIEELNMKQLVLSQENMKEDRDEEKIKALRDEFMTFYYQDIMSRPTMVAMQSAEKAFSAKIAFVKKIIEDSAEGEDPYTIEESSCTGSCASCAGCH